MGDQSENQEQRLAVQPPSFDMTISVGPVSVKGSLAAFPFPLPVPALTVKYYTPTPNPNIKLFNAIKISKDGIRQVIGQTERSPDGTVKKEFSSDDPFWNYGDSAINSMMKKSNGPLRSIHNHHQSLKTPSAAPCESQSHARRPRTPSAPCGHQTCAPPRVIPLANPPP
jgi:hypothetical protein